MTPQAPEPTAGFTDISYRRWAWFFVVFFAGVALLVLGNVLPGHYANLAGYLLYMSLACTFLPLNTLWIVLWMAVQFPAWLVALVGAVGTALANLNDYYLLSYLFKFDSVNGIRQKPFYLKALAWFDRSPFLTLALFSFLPIPVDVVRLLAISRRYSRRRFTAASFLGRLPRYYVLARGWQWLNLSNWYILVVMVLVAAAFLLRHLRWGRLLRGLRSVGGKRSGAVPEVEASGE